jgi:MFS family permease
MNNQRNPYSHNSIFLGLVSLCNDFGSEMARNLMPTLLISFGASPAILGLIESISSICVSSMYPLAGWYSDAIGKRKPFACIGYGLGFISLAAVLCFLGSGLLHHK